MPRRQAARRLTRSVLGSAAPRSTRSQRRLEPCCPRHFAEGRQIYKRACIFHRKRSFLYSRFRGPFSQLALGLDSQQGFPQNQWFRLEATVRQLAPDHAKRRSPCRQGDLEKITEHNEKSTLCSRGLREAILDVFGRRMSDFGSKVGPKWSHNGPNVAPKRVSDRVFDS